MGKIAFVFSGQGAQHPGMGKELTELSGAAKYVFAMADQIRPGTSRQCFEASHQELSVTVNTQPCLFCVDLAAALTLKEHGILPDAVAGFSLGEIPALAFSDMLSYADAFKLVCLRAEYMHKCSVRYGGVMLAVLGLSPETVKQLCSNYANAYPVNYNSPLQTVVACTEDVQPVLTQAVKESGGKAMKLPVSGSFHSPFMNEASAKLKNVLSHFEIKPYQIPVYSNVTAVPYEDAGLISKQVNSPVLWQKTIENMIADGVEYFIEVGAGKTLSGLIKKISPEANVWNVEDRASLENTLEGLKHVRG